MQGIRFLAVALTVMTGAVTAAFAESLEDGIAAYRHRDWSKAIELLQPLADRGEPRAEELIGRMYERGVGVRRDYHAAEQWYRRAAEKGEPNAAARLGFMYRVGEGVPRDLAEAARWYKQGAEKGNRLAQAGLAFLLLEGHGLPADPAAAAVLMRKSADQGNAEAQLALGSLYEQGRGVPKDLVQADAWYTLAIIDDGENDADLFERAKRDKKRVEEKLTPLQLGQAQEAVRAFKPVPPRD